MRPMLRAARATMAIRKNQDEDSSIIGISAEIMANYHALTEADDHLIDILGDHKKIRFQLWHTLYLNLVSKDKLGEHK